MNHDVIYRLYPSVIKIDDKEGAFDKKGKRIEIDEVFVEEQAESIMSDIRKTQLKAEMKAEAIRIAQERVLDAEIAKNPYLSAMANVEAKIDSGEINENARKAIRDRV